MIRIEVIHEARVRLIRYGWSWRKFWFVDEAETFAATSRNRAERISMFWDYEDGNWCGVDLGLRIKYAVEDWRRSNQRKYKKELEAAKLSKRWRPLTKQ